MTEENHGYTVGIPGVSLDSNCEPPEYTFRSLPSYQPIWSPESLSAFISSGGRLGFKHGASPDMSFWHEALIMNTEGRLVNIKTVWM
jgi:hypothetical protein